MIDDPRVSVIVPVRDAASTLPATVASVAAQDGVDEIVLAVAPSRDGTDEVARALAGRDPRIVVVHNAAGTTPAGLNAALRASTGEVVARCDAHAVLPAGYVPLAVDLLARTGAGNVGGRQVPVAERGFAAAVAAAMRSPLGSGGATYRSGRTAGPAETVYLGVFRREAIEAVGGFDERLVRNQDYELNHRLRQAGWEVYFDPALAVSYRPRADVAGLARQYRDYGRYKRLVIREHTSSLRLRQFAPLAMVAGMVAAGVLGVLWRTWWPLAVALGGYGLLVVVAAIAADPRRAPAIAVALATMHWCWALGFLLGPPRLTTIAPG